MSGDTPRLCEERPTGRAARLQPALIVNTGDGKGKTTAAMGAALRAWRQGWSIAVFQFIKSDQWRSGERIALEALGAEHVRTGAGGPVEWHVTGPGRRMAHREDRLEAAAAAAREAWADVRRRLAEERHRLYVLDEFTYPLNYGWIDVTDVVATLRDRPGMQHVIVTGRRAPQTLVGIATTVTEMRKLKHPFDEGQRGQEGIEW
jgi:cob(I)alamin adenosyltransferase